MFERFTKQARHVVVLAQEEARRLNHNYIGTEHVLLGLLGERGGIACRVLEGVGMSLDGAREEVRAVVGPGKKTPTGHIPFTPRAKKTLELALREALQLRHNFIGTEHILLGLIREGDGVAAQVMRNHADLLAIRAAVLDLCPAGQAQTGRVLGWLRRGAFMPGEAGIVSEGPAEQATLTATPAADATLSEAARLAGAQPVGSHHLLLAALADADSAAARALGNLGIDIEQAREALRDMDVRGTSDEQPEAAGRRQMVIHVREDRLTIEVSDPLIVEAGQEALRALGEDAVAAGTIQGDQAAAASLGAVWLALQESLAAIQQGAAPPEAA